MSAIKSEPDNAAAELPGGRRLTSENPNEAEGAAAAPHETVMDQYEREHQQHVDEARDIELARRDTILRKQPKYVVRQDSLMSKDPEHAADVQRRVMHNIQVSDAEARQI